MRAPSHYNPQNGNIYCYPQAVHSGMRYRPEPPIHMGGEKRNGPATEFEWRCAEPGTVAAIVSAMVSTGVL
jgi:hypothetical protein